MRNRLAVAILSLSFAGSGCSKKPAPAAAGAAAPSPVAAPSAATPPPEAAPSAATAPPAAPTPSAAPTPPAETAPPAETPPPAVAVPPVGGEAPPPGGEVPPSAPAAAAPHTTPPAATLKRVAGQVEPTRLPAKTTAPTGVTVHGGATYVAFELPELRRIGWTFDAHIVIGGERKGLGVLEVSGPSGEPANSSRVLVRLAGEEPLPAKLELELAAGPLRGSNTVVEPWNIVAVTLEGEAPKAPNLDKAFFLALESSIRAAGSEIEPFWAFTVHRARLMAARGDLTQPELAEWRNRGGDHLAEMGSLYTGLTSIEEALQADRGLRVRGASADKRKLPLADIEAVPLAQHDWATLQAGKTPEVEPLAASVPADALYVHFHDLRMAVRLGRELDEWLSPVLPMIEWRAGPTHMMKRYEEQLVIERSALSEALGNLAADGVALVLGDPFVREGSDLSILFKIKEETLLTTALATYEAKARAAHADLTETTYTLGALTVRQLSTPDRRVNQHRVKLGDVLVISNSRAAVERLAAVAEGTQPSLAKSDDFRYFRTRYPFSKEAEDGFVFVSDAFVAKAVSPRTRILEARRMEALADLRAVDHAALMYGLLEGRPAPDAAALQAAGVLAAEELKHADGAVITFDQRVGATSSWGSGSFVTPLAELELSTVSQAEKDAYDAFRGQYQNYWRRYIDPIGVRIDMDPATRKLSFDMTIMPLISGTKYDDVREMTGVARFRPGVVPGTAQWTVAIGRESGLRRELDGVARFLAGKLEFSWLGQMAFAGVAEGPVARDLALLTESPPVSERTDRGSDAEALAVLDNAPLYAGVEIANPLAFAATMTALRAMAESTIPGVIEWSEGGKYRDVAITRVTAKTGGFIRGARSVDLEYALAGGVFVLAMERSALEKVIDGLLDGNGPTPLPDDRAAEGVQAQFGIHTMGPALAEAGMIMVERSAFRQWRKAHRDAELLERVFGPTTEESRRTLGLAFLGYDPIVLQGGSFSPGRGGLVHSLYGTPMAPKLPDVPVAGAPLTKLLSALNALTLALSIDGDGAGESLHVQGSWSRNE